MNLLDAGFRREYRGAGKRGVFFGKVGEQLSADHPSSRPRYGGGQSVIGVSWGHIVHIRCVSQNPLECFFLPAAQPVFTLWGMRERSFVTCRKSVFVSVSTERHTF